MDYRSIVETLVKEACLHYYYDPTLITLNDSIKCCVNQIMEIIQKAEDKLKQKNELLQDALKQYQELEKRYCELVDATQGLG